MRWRSALTGRSTDETDIGRSSQDEGNSNAREATSPGSSVTGCALNQQPARSRATAHPCTTTISTSVEVQGLGPWRGLGRRPNLPLPQRQMVRAPAHNSTTAPIPRSGFVHGSNVADGMATGSMVLETQQPVELLAGRLALPT